MESKISIGDTRRRRRKVYYANYAYQGGFFHPLIRIEGKYLKEYGFNIGDHIEVSVAMGKITISKVPDDYLPP